MSTYLQFHHGCFWFQIKVPKSLIARYGDVVCQNLQTSDRAVASIPDPIPIPESSTHEDPATTRIVCGSPVQAAPTGVLIN